MGEPMSSEEFDRQRRIVELLDAVPMIMLQRADVSALASIEQDLERRGLLTENVKYSIIRRHSETYILARGGRTMLVHEQPPRRLGLWRVLKEGPPELVAEEDELRRLTRPGTP